MQSTQGIFEDVKEFPDSSASRRFKSLVGLDEIKERLLKEARLLLDPDSLTVWAAKHHSSKLRIIELFRNRAPLFIFSGDVGTGKTALAETFGDAVARDANISITLYELSLTARGTGAVGEMTSLISSAFSEIRNAAKRSIKPNRKFSSGVVLLIDEADALAQSRELAQMHHEDRAGVNALIRGIDEIANGELPAIVVMCTNRIDALDPAVRRRAAATFAFSRPNEAQRLEFLQPILEELGLSHQQISTIVQETGSNKSRAYGHTYSDLSQRLVPAFLLASYPTKPITYEVVKRAVEQHPPTPPFKSEVS